MASLGGQQENYPNIPPVENTPKRVASREGSAERKVSKDREEKLKYARDRQNEERHRKIEELKAQAEAAQRYREQKEEERRRRIEDMRVRDTEKRHQVEERKKAIFEAEKERREYILKKNQERESRIETKRRDRNSIGFAFGSSTPRLLDVPADYGLVSPSAFWGQRRSTSISNVAGGTLSRRSSERELTDSGAKKRASSSADRHEDHRRKSSSITEVFNWGYMNDEPPKRFSLSIVSSEINIDSPIATASQERGCRQKNIANHKEDIVDTSPIVFRSVYRRKTDLMPTIPSPREGHYGSRSSLSATPRTPGRAYSMNRLDQLAQPIRRNGEHMHAIQERERRERELYMLDETASLGGEVRGSNFGQRLRNGSGANNTTSNGIMSRSMTHLAGGTSVVQRDRGKYSLGGGISSNFRPLGNRQNDSSKSMTQISHSWSSTPNTPPNPQRHPNLALQTAATKKYLESSFASSASSNANRRRQQNYATTNPNRNFDPSSLLFMNTSSLLVNAGSRSGNVTPGGHLNNSRPGSAMSTSTTMSSSGYVPRRPTNAPRKPRPASIAGTGMSLEEISKHRKDHKPPVRKPAGSPSTSTAQTTPKRIGNLMTTSLIVTSSSSRINSAEKKTPPKRDITVPKAASASKVLPSRAASSERIGRFNNAAVAPKPFIETNAVTAPNVEAPKESELVASKEISFKGEAENIGDPNYHISLMEPTAPLPFVESKEEQIQILPEVDVSDAKEKSSPTLENTMTAEKVASEKQSEPVFIEKENELSAMVPNADGTEQMTASMMARKITTEEEAKAALAERRRLAREEAERQQELERQRIEAEQLALLKHQEEEAERQRQFEEEATRLAEEQRRSEEERLRKAIEEVKQREEEEQRRRFEEERQRAEREETEKKAKEEAEKQRVEVAERLKREEKEREERRKRVEAIMSRTRKGGGNSSVAQTSTPTKELIDNSKAVVNPKESSESSSNNSTGSPSNAESSLIPQGNTRDVLESFGSHPSNPMIDDTMVDKEASLIKSFTGMIIDENSKNLQQFEVNNGKLHADLKSSTIATTAVANGNGHMENVNNKNDINILQDAVTSGTTQLIDLNIQSQELHNNNNNSLLTTTTATTTLVTADSNESKDISLL